jgi:hypothetical protein
MIARATRCVICWMARGAPMSSSPTARLRCRAANVSSCARCWARSGQRAERAIDATAQGQVARLRGRRGWRYGRDRGGRIQTPWGEQFSRRWQGALLGWAIELDDAARARDRARVLGLILGRVAHAHSEARARQQAAEDARAELLELCAAAASVPGISLVLLAGELGVARQTLHESLARVQREGPLNPPPRWHELTTDRDVRAP